MLVVSRGDETLLRFRSRTGRHFPQLEDGTWAGFYPADGAAAVAHLSKLAAAGASHLVFPKPALWWLDHYGELREHLEHRARLLACESRARGRLGARAGRTASRCREPYNDRGRTPPSPTTHARSRSIGGSSAAAPAADARRIALGRHDVLQPGGLRIEEARTTTVSDRGLADAGVPLLARRARVRRGALRAWRRATPSSSFSCAGRDVLWQKERLLNIGVQQLPDDCDKVAWLDADVLFARRDWAQETARLLESYVAVQPFSHSRPPAARDRRRASQRCCRSAPAKASSSTASPGASARRVARSLASYDRARPHRIRLGRAAELLDEHGLYDANLLGNGDTDIAHAMFGNSRLLGRSRSSATGRARICDAGPTPFAAAVGRKRRARRRCRHPPLARRVRSTGSTTGRSTFCTGSTPTVTSSRTVPTACYGGPTTHRRSSARGRATYFARPREDG